MNNCLTLAGSVSELSRAGLFADGKERMTVLVSGAEPMYAELRVPNQMGWLVGQRVMIMILPTALWRPTWDETTQVPAATTTKS